MENFVKNSLLYDFYGDLLTDHQKKIYEAYNFENLTHAEIAEEEGVSRQAVFDLLKRCYASLEEYESKLHLVERFMKIREKVQTVEACTELDEAKKIAEEILELL